MNAVEVCNSDSHPGKCTGLTPQVYLLWFRFRDDMGGTYCSSG